ncbi:hypothetical protein BDZ91DRAFT_735821, partial [Kalaharituber pfeilii]
MSFHGNSFFFDSNALLFFFKLLYSLLVLAAPKVSAWTYPISGILLTAYTIFLLSGRSNQRSL